MLTSPARNTSLHRPCAAATLPLSVSPAIATICMRSVPTLGRALLLGGVASVSACDIVDFVSNPAPRFQQTWNIPAAGTDVSVGSILPNGVVIYSTPSSSPADSSAFNVSINDMNFSRRLGADCASCDALNGTVAVKPAFTLLSGSSEPLPQDMISGAVTGGAIRIAVRNELSFDPLRVRSSGNQGFMLLVVRSGSLVLSRDSVNGATTPMPPGDSVVRTLPFTTGSVTGNISVELTIESPASDTAVFLNANGNVRARAVVTQLLTANVLMNVVNKTLASAGNDSIALDGLEEGITRRVVGGALEMSVTNPFPLAGNMEIIFGRAPGQPLVKPVPLPSGPAQQRLVFLDSAEIQSILGNRVALNIGGIVNSAAPITVGPRQKMVILNRLRLTIRTGGGD